MVFGIGTDIVEVKRIRKAIEKRAFVEKVFTSNEIKYCSSLNSKAQSYAARFAAKEAFFKAVGTGLRKPLSFQDISIENNDLGKPEIFLKNLTEKYINELKINNILLSISHIKEYATAFVILEKSQEEK